MYQQVRQGDVLLSKTRDIKGACIRPDGDRIILAHGETTGHCHEVIENRAIAGATDDIPAAQLFEDPSDGQRYLLVSRACVLTHQEHGAIPLTPGAYRVGRQSEYSPEEIRQVAD